MNDLADWAFVKSGGTELRILYQPGSHSAVITRIDQLEPSLHAFITRTSELAMAQAKLPMISFSPNESYPQDSTRLLCGLPFGERCPLPEKRPLHKRVQDSRKLCCTLQCTAVQKLLDAGVVVIGKTNTDEFAMDLPRKTQPTVQRIILDLERVPGGSSGGSAAAVAARMIPAGLGTIQEECSPTGFFFAGSPESNPPMEGFRVMA